MKSFWLAVGCAWGLTLLAGCLESQTPSQPRRIRASAGGEPDDVAKAITYLERIDEYEERSARAQAAYGFNRWLDTQKVSTDWQPDEMVNRLPRVVRERGVLEELPRRRFDQDDMRFVQESIWMRQLSGWVSRQPVDPLFATWIKGQKEAIGEFPAESLAAAFRLFDWTVRNIRLDELLKSPDEAVIAPAVGTSEGSANAPAVPAALRGIPGPGYQFDPIQVLLYGHGDVWQRMRVFTLMARQQGLNVVTLGFPGRTIPPRPRPWVSGVLIGEELYLFDLRLGLPVLGKDGGIATLSQVLAEPALLDRMEIGNHSYDVPAEDLAEVVALVDIVAPALSHRMQLAEKQLVGEHRTVFTVPLSKLANQLRACRGISDVYVWSIPFEAEWYRAAVDKILENDMQAASQHMAKYSMFMNRNPLVRGRIAYLRGQIESEEEMPGAKTLLSQTRMSEADLQGLESNPELQKHFGLQRTPNQQQWQAQIEMFRSMLTQTKQHASFWLGMCQLESGRPDAAIEWLKSRTLEVWPDGEWSSLARYNLARAYELLDNDAEAQQLLLADKSLQEHGSYLRARLLEEQLKSNSQPAEQK